jgi:hypothetical protein
MASHPLQYLIRPETMKAHRASWYVYSGAYGEMERAESGRSYYGMGYDAKCSCGWESKTGGATRTSVQDALWTHRRDEQNAADEGLPNSDPATWPHDVLTDYLERHAAELRADAEHNLEGRVS